MKYTFSLLAFLLAQSVLVQAQFRGGVGDGHAVGTAINQPTGRNIFLGGADDGHSVVAIANQPLGRNIFLGGIDDGHAMSLATNQPTGRNIFLGGLDDGYATALAPNQPLGRNIFLGGADDGYAVSIAPNQGLGRNIFFGGVNDGWAMALGNAVLTSPLPVTLLSFTGRWQQAHGLLLWQTATEKGSAYFELQRSDNGSDFVPVASLAAAGESATVRDYQYLDSNRKNLLPPGVSTVYYRLRSIDVDGKTAYSGIVILRAERGVLTQYSLYPNPAHEYVVVTTSDAVVPEGTIISLTEAGGRLLKQERMTTVKQQVNVSTLPAGTYFLQLSAAGKLLYTQKIIIIK